MPPRLTLSSILGASSRCLRPVKPAAPSSLISVANASTKAKAKAKAEREKKRARDPYAIAQSEARKLANLERRKQLEAERNSTLGDPVRGNTTPFIVSLDRISNTIPKTPSSSSSELVLRDKDEQIYLNHFLTPSEVAKSLQHSYILTQPQQALDRGLVDPEKEKKQIDCHNESHERAVAAIARIVDLRNGNAKDRTRAHTQRIIATFGRHVTDEVLPPRLASHVPRGPDAVPKAVDTPRAGPDTGSSEVQIALLTAKIKFLADALEKVGPNKDQVNKRNLRLLVHKRQKLLKYLRKKEKGGPRWKNLVETLGLVDGMWKGEITL